MRTMTIERKFNCMDLRWIHKERPTIMRKIGFSREKTEGAPTEARKYEFSRGIIPESTRPNRKKFALVGVEIQMFPD